MNSVAAGILMQAFALEDVAGELEELNFPSRHPPGVRALRANSLITSTSERSTMKTNMQPKLYRLIDLATTKKKAGLLPVCPATIWRWVHMGSFPKPFKLGPSVTVWRAEEVDQFIASAQMASSAGIEPVSES